MKKCSRCKQTKPTSEFYKYGNRPGFLCRCKTCSALSFKEYRKRTGYEKKRYAREKIKNREKHLVKKYGVDLASYDKMLALQNHKCAICQCQNSEKRQLSVDHNHETGHVRGLLCTRCNFLLGYAGESKSTLAAAIEYLARFE